MKKRLAKKKAKEKNGGRITRRRQRELLRRFDAASRKYISDTEKMYGGKFGPFNSSNIGFVLMSAQALRKHMEEEKTGAVA